MTAPLIGITSAPRKDHHDWRYIQAYALNVEAVEAAGGIPVVVPANVQDATLRQIYARLDGVLLPGGGDVDPACYGAERHPATKQVWRQRDEVEIRLAQWAVRDERPLFGICRGHQVFNVAMGGTLIQDVPTMIETDLQHDINEGMPRSTRLHDVDVTGDSRLSDVLGSEHFSVNSLHHQSVHRLADKLNATAYAPDGIIEAAEVEGHPFALSVQWHPEDLVPEDEVMRRLFSAFVDASARHG